MEHLKKRTINLFKVLSDPVRFEILEFIKNNPCTSIKIQTALDISQSYASHQLNKLYNADLIEYEKKGKIKIYKPRNNGIYKLIALIQSYIFTIEKEKLDRLSLFNEDHPIGSFKDII